MKMVAAKVLDSTHLELSQPIGAEQGRTVLVSVLDTGELDAERQQWYALSTECLRSAYGDSEPEYQATMVKESNPDYRA